MRGFRRDDGRSGPIWLAIVVLGLLPLLWTTRSSGAAPLDPRRQTSGEYVRRAFHEVVADVSRSTVRITSGGADAALGAIVGSDGWILTKATQISGDMRCRLHDGREFAATVVGVHREFDLALLKIDARGLPAIRWKADADPTVGAWLATSGPQELPLAVGVCSVGRRKIPAESGVLGISVSQADFGLTITKVFPNSGAHEAGLQAGDIITRVAGEVVQNSAAFAGLLRQVSPGDLLTIRILRGGYGMDVRAKLGYPLESILNRSMFQNRIAGELSMRRAGFPTALQHDTVLRPEDCGGPLVDLSGAAVGINIARSGRTETLAIPAGEIVPLLDDLKSGKYAPLPLERFQLRPEPPPLPETIAEP